MLKSKLIKIFFTIFVFITISCKSQDKIDLKGSNWTNCSQKTFDNQYVEIFFDQDFYYFYDENFGLRVGGNFSFENGNFYIKTISADEFIKVIFNKNEMILNYQGTSFTFRRIPEKKYTLENLVRKNIDENDFFDSGFNKRKNECQ